MGMEAFFRPRRVVVIGASTNPVGLGYGVARNLVEGGFPGEVYLVNPKGGTLFGRPLYPSVEALPETPDLAVIIVPAPATPAVLEACGRKGVSAAIVAAGGFREVGPEGEALEEQIVAIARRYGMRLIGPNCIGVIDTHLPLDTTFLPPPPPPRGEVAFLSHSGALAAAVIDWMRGQGMGFSRLVSLGNQADVSETDVLPWVAEDERTRVVTMYLESVADGRRFVAAARQAARRKPLVAVKVGRFAAGQRAAASHTGALAGAEQAFEAAFRRAGVLRATTMEEMFDWARALAWCPLPRGRRVAVLTNAGGPGVTAADAVEAHGLCLADLSEATQAALRALLPPAASVHNPVDMLASASPEQYAEALRLLLADESVDMVLVILPPPPMFSAGAVAKAMLPHIQRTEKPVVVALMGEPLVAEARAHLRAARVPDYPFPERAAGALAALARRAEALARLDETPWPRPAVDRTAAERALAGEEPGWLPADRVRALLQAYGLPLLPEALATTPEEAVAAAERLGYPVALKVQSPDVPHKSDVGGVALGLGDATAVAQAFERMLAQVREAVPQARLDGVLVQPMAPAGQEVIVGVTRDPLFGPLLMFGSGGVAVEALGDVAFALAPPTPAEVEELLHRTWAGRQLAGFRHIPPADREAVVDALVRLAYLAADFPQIAEMEINPLRVLGPGQGAVALDVRVRLAPVGQA